MPFRVRAAALEGQGDDGVVDVAHGAELRVGEYAADRLDAGDLSHEPPGEIEIMDAHVDDQAAARLGIGVVRRGRVRISRRRLEDYRVADRPFTEPRLGGDVASVEPAHESELEEHAGRLDHPLHLERIVERNGERLLAEDGLAGGGRRLRDRPVRVGGRDDHDSIDRPIVDDSLWVNRAERHVELTHDGVHGRLREVGDRRQARAGDSCRQIACVDAPEPAEPDQSDVQLPCARCLRHTDLPSNRYSRRLSSTAKRFAGSASAGRNPGAPWF